MRPAEVFKFKGSRWMELNLTQFRKRNLCRRGKKTPLAGRKSSRYPHQPMREVLNKLPQNGRKRIRIGL